MSTPDYFTFGVDDCSGRPAANRAGVSAVAPEGDAVSAGTPADSARAVALPNDSTAAGVPSPSTAGRAARSATWAYVMAFAEEMEKKLAANRHKGDRKGWVSHDGDELVAMMEREISELRAELVGRYGTAIPQGVKLAAIREECADVANFAMMIADVCGGLAPAAPEADEARLEAPR